MMPFICYLRHKRNGAGQFALLRFGCRRPADCHTTHTQTHTHTHPHSTLSLTGTRGMHHNALSSGAPDAAARSGFASSAGTRRRVTALWGTWSAGTRGRGCSGPREVGPEGWQHTYVSTRLTAGFGARGVATYQSSQTGKRGQERGGSGPSSKIYS